MVHNKSSQMSTESRMALKRVLEQRARLYALNLNEFTALARADQVNTTSISLPLKVYSKAIIMHCTNGRTDAAAAAAAASSSYMYTYRVSHKSLVDAQDICAARRHRRHPVLMHM